MPRTPVGRIDPARPYICRFRNLTVTWNPGKGDFRDDRVDPQDDVRHDLVVEVLYVVTRSLDLRRAGGARPTMPGKPHDQRVGIAFGPSAEARAYLISVVELPNCG
jgi:hypothetical protein